MPARSNRTTDATDQAEIDEIRERVANLASGTGPWGTGIDLLMLSRAEVRDEAWAARMEAEIDAALSAIDFVGYGMSLASIRCAESVCEIAVLQDSDTADLDAGSWQTRFIQLSDGGAWDESLLETAMISTRANDGRVAYFSYLHFTRAGDS
jgi:hypothetical protein